MIRSVVMVCCPSGSADDYCEWRANVPISERVADKRWSPSRQQVASQSR